MFVPSRWKGSIVLLSCLLVGWSIALVLWSHVLLPFRNPSGIIGPLTLLRFNPQNNLLRYAIFCFMPSFLLLCFWKKVSGYFPHATELAPAASGDPVTNSRLSTTLFTICTCLLLLSSFLPSPNTGPIDLFHEGEMLTPAINFLHGRGIYTGSFFIHGAFYDCLTSVCAWKIFGVQSLGALREMLRFLIGFAALSLAMLVLSLRFFLLRVGRKDIATVYSAMALCLLVCTMGGGGIYVIDRRDACLLLSVATMFFAYGGLLDPVHPDRKKRLVATGLFAGALCPIQLFYTIDRGAYLVVFLLVAAVYPFFLRDRVETKRAASLCLGTLGGIFLFSAGFGLILGKAELSAFVENFCYFAGSKDLFDSYIYPFTALNRKTLPLLIISTGQLLCLRNFLSGRRSDPSQIILLFFTVLATSYYRSALGRSDMAHVLYASLFVALLLLPIAWAILGRIGPLLTKPAAWKRWAALCGITATFLALSPTPRANVSAAARGLLALPERLTPDRELLAREDISFLSPVDAHSYVALRKLMEDSRQTSYEALASGVAWNYLLRLPSASRFHLPWFAMPADFQSRLVHDIALERPLYLGYSSRWRRSIDGIPNEFRLPHLFRFLYMNYRFYRKEGNMEVFRLRDKSLSTEELRHAVATAPAGEWPGRIASFDVPPTLRSRGGVLQGWAELGKDNQPKAILVMSEGKLLTVTGQHIEHGENYSGWAGYVNIDNLPDGVHNLQAYVLSEGVRWTLPGRATIRVSMGKSTVIKLEQD